MHQKINGLSATINASILSASALAAVEPNTASQNKSRIVGAEAFFESLNTNIIVGWSEMSAPYAIDGDFSPVDFIDFGTEKPNYYEHYMIEWRTGGLFPSPFGMGQDIDFIAGLFASTS